jgi:hypothetical protein
MVQLQGCAVPYQIAPCFFVWICRFCAVQGSSGADISLNEKAVDFETDLINSQQRGLDIRQT